MGDAVSAKTLKRLELAATPITDKLIDDMLHGNGIPRCDEWDVLVRHAKALETSFYRVNRQLDDACAAHAQRKGAKRKGRRDV